MIFIVLKVQKILLKSVYKEIKKIDLIYLKLSKFLIIKKK